MDKKSIGFWIFSLDDPELYQFYTEQESNKSLYYALYIEKCTRDFPPETKEVLHLRENSILLTEPYLIPLFYHLCLKGYVAIISESFWVSDEGKALVKLSFIHNMPEGIINMGHANVSQKKCMKALYQEYFSPISYLWESTLRNLVANLILLSPETNYEGQFKSGHLLNNALQFITMIDNYAFSEKKKCFYADKMNITGKMLDKSLRDVFHSTFKSMMANYIVIEAMRLLIFSNKSINQIAHELGYDVSDFIRFFARWKGMHPKVLRVDYRKIINDIENGY